MHRCIGRIAWNTLVVRDKRHVTDLAEMFAECMEHQRLATADGRCAQINQSIKKIFDKTDHGTNCDRDVLRVLLRIICRSSRKGNLVV